MRIGWIERVATDCRIRNALSTLSTAEIDLLVSCLRWEQVRLNRLTGFDYEMLDRHGRVNDLLHKLQGRRQTPTPLCWSITTDAVRQP